LGCVTWRATRRGRKEGREDGEEHSGRKQAKPKQKKCIYSDLPLSHDEDAGRERD